MVELTDGQKKLVLNERGRIARRGRIRQLVFGSIDGLLVPLGVVSAVAGGTGSVRAVVAAGLAEAFAGALSMGAGEFLSGRAEAQVQQSEILDEHRSIEENPEYELNELALLFEQDGVPAPDARSIARMLQASPAAFAKTMMEKELGLIHEPNAVRIAEGFTIGTSYLIGSLIPLSPYFLLPVRSALPVSVGLTFVVLAAIGSIRGRLAKINLVRSAIEVLAVGALTGGGGYLLGTFLPRALGF